MFAREGDLNYVPGFEYLNERELGEEKNGRVARASMSIIPVLLTSRSDSSITDYSKSRVKP